MRTVGDEAQECAQKVTLGSSHANYAKKGLTGPMFSQGYSVGASADHGRTHGDAAKLQAGAHPGGMPAYAEGPGLVRANVGAFGGTGVSSDRPGAGSDAGLARAMLQLTAQISELATLVAKFVGEMAEERSASTMQ